MKKILLPGAVILVSLWLFFSLPTPADNYRHNYSTTVRNFNDQPFFKVVSYSEKYCLFRCGSIHVVKNFRDGDYREITSFWHPDPEVSPPAGGTNIKNENFAYFWFGGKFGATADGGKTWSIWDAGRDPLMKDAASHDLIENVQISDDGRGRMFFDRAGQSQSGISFLRTEDFGKTWHR